MKAMKARTRGDHPSLVPVSHILVDVSAHMHAREVVEALVAAVEREEQQREAAALRARVATLTAQLTAASAAVEKLEKERADIATQARMLHGAVRKEVHDMERRLQDRDE